MCKSMEQSFVKSNCTHFQALLLTFFGQINSIRVLWGIKFLNKAMDDA